MDKEPIIPFPGQGWRKRLDDAVKASGRSRRAVSLAAGLAPNYLHTLLGAPQKEPTIGNLQRVCQTLNVALGWIIQGISLDPQTEELLRLAADLTPEQRGHLLEFLRAGKLR